MLQPLQPLQPPQPQASAAASSQEQEAPAAAGPGSFDPQQPPRFAVKNVARAANATATATMPKMIQLARFMMLPAHHGARERPRFLKLTISYFSAHGNTVEKWTQSADPLEDPWSLRRALPPQRKCA